MKLSATQPTVAFLNCVKCSDSCNIKFLRLTGQWRVTSAIEVETICVMLKIVPSESLSLQFISEEWSAAWSTALKQDVLLGTRKQLTLYSTTFVMFAANDMLGRRGISELLVAG